MTSAHACCYVWALKHVIWMDSLQPYHCSSWALLIEMIESGMILFQQLYQPFCLAICLSFGTHWWTLEPLAPVTQSNWSVLTVIFCILKDFQSLARAHFYSDLMIARSWPHMSWQQSLILFIWASIQSLPLLSLQDTLTLFLYFFVAVQMNTSSVSDQERHSPEAVSRLESAMFPLDKSDSEDVQALVLFDCLWPPHHQGRLEL